MSPVSPEALRSYALGKPATEEVETWGHPTFRVGGHIFVGLSEDGETATLHTSQAEQDELVSRDPEVFTPAPHVGPHGWTTVRLTGVATAELHELVDAAYDRTAG